jgi:hypothetical protein
MNNENGKNKSIKDLKKEAENIGQKVDDFCEEVETFLQTKQEELGINKVVTYPKPESTEEVREIYDTLRKNLPFVPPPDIFIVTSTVASMEADDQEELVKKAKKFDEFVEGDDPHGEHDFVSLEHKGQIFYMTFEWYGGQDGYRVVITLMNAKDW